MTDIELARMTCRRPINADAAIFRSDNHPLSNHPLPITATPQFWSWKFEADRRSTITHPSYLEIAAD